jgi:hypothetical protein
VLTSSAAAISCSFRSTGALRLVLLSPARNKRNHYWVLMLSSLFYVQFSLPFPPPPISLSSGFTYLCFLLRPGFSTNLHFQACLSFLLRLAFVS